MPIQASLLFAWSAVHTFVCVFSLVLYLRLRGGIEYAGYSIASMGMALYTIGGAFLILAPDMDAAVHAERVQFLGIGMGLPGMVLLLCGVMGLTRSALVKTAFAVGAIGIVANLAGLFFDPAVPTASAWTRPEAALLPAGILFSYACLAVTAWAFAATIRKGALHDHDMQLIFIWLSPAVAAWLHDTLVRTLGWSQPFVLEHVAVLSSVGITYVLLGRLVRLDDALRDRTHELRHSYEELQLVQDELVRKEQLAAVGELSAVIANEVKSPLEALRQAVGSLADGSLPADEQEHLLGTLDDETDRLNRLVRDLLTYARPVEPQHEQIGVEELVQAATSGSSALDDTIRIDMNLSEGPPTIQADRDLLAKALAHIVDNAVQAMPEGGVLTIRGMLEMVDGLSCLAVSFHDTGEGMDQLVREKARDPFFTTRPSGTGLGLAIVERVVQAHGGRVELQSSYGQGTTVTVTLPTERRTSLLPLQEDDRLPAGLDQTPTARD